METAKALVVDFDRTLNNWLQQLEGYSTAQLLAKPAENSWSAGQVYMHVIEATEYFLKQVTICASNNNNESEEASPAAKRMFLNNDFPDAILEGPPTNAFTQQPVSKDDLVGRMARLKEKIDAAAAIMVNSTYRGKTKHPGLRYFDAAQWFQFAEMHIRHHERQLARISRYLKEQDIK